ncbi:hypothetical protein GF377_09040 [candidate division GN15 bacterium]|nr:hypothetical protein [candidate division GN15 bacterium]
MQDNSTEHDSQERRQILELLETVDELGEDTKDLALNLALYLAKAKAKTDSVQLKQMEPEFIRLVNGTIKVVHELSTILRAARNQETMVYELPSGQLAKDHIEQKLELIASQCNQILEALGERRDITV